MRAARRHKTDAGVFRHDADAVSGAPRDGRRPYVRHLALDRRRTNRAASKRFSTTARITRAAARALRGLRSYRARRPSGVDALRRHRPHQHDAVAIEDRAAARDEIDRAQTLLVARGARATVLGESARRRAAKSRIRRRRRTRRTPSSRADGSCAERRGGTPRDVGARRVQGSQE